MKITKISESPIIPIDFTAYKLFANQNIEIINLILKPREVLDRHNNTFNVLFIVQSGKAILEFGNERTVVEKGNIIEAEKDIERGWINIGEEDLNLLIIKFLK